MSANGVIVWQQIGADGNYKVYYNDTSTSQGPTLLSGYKSAQINPRIFGDNVIWKDSRGSKSYDIYLKNLKTGVETKLATDTGPNTADIWNDYVVWDYNGKMSMLNIQTKEQKVISTSSVYANPSINEGKISYVQTINSKSYVHVYDIQAASVTKIDTSLNAGSFPVYDSGYVAWDDTPTWPSTDKNIFIAKL
jgi:beta propeller repeat protein